MCVREREVATFPTGPLSLLCRDAAEGAGLNVLRLIHEPAAALLAYDVGQNCSSGRRYNSVVAC